VEAFYSLLAYWAAAIARIWRSFIGGEDGMLNSTVYADLISCNSELSGVIIATTLQFWEYGYRNLSYARSRIMKLLKASRLG